MNPTLQLLAEALMKIYEAAVDLCRCSSRRCHSHWYLSMTAIYSLLVVQEANQTLCLSWGRVCSCVKGFRGWINAGTGSHYRATVKWQVVNRTWGRLLVCFHLHYRTREDVNQWDGWLRFLPYPKGWSMLNACVKRIIILMMKDIWSN